MLRFCRTHFSRLFWVHTLNPAPYIRCAEPLAAVRAVTSQYRMTNKPPPTKSVPPSSSSLLSSLELSDTRVCEPRILALLGPASHFCEVPPSLNSGLRGMTGPQNRGRVHRMCTRTCLKVTSQYRMANKPPPTSQYLRPKRQTPPLSPHCSRANMAHTRQLRLEYGLDIG